MSTPGSFPLSPDTPNYPEKEGKDDNESSDGSFTDAVESGAAASKGEGVAAGGGDHHDQDGVPKLVLEKTPDDFQPYGSVPGTKPYEARLADAVPDEIHVRDTDLPASSPARSRAATLSKPDGPPPDLPVPMLVLEKIEGEGGDDEKGGAGVHPTRLADAGPDEVVASLTEKPIPSPPGSPKIIDDPGPAMTSLPPPLGTEDKSDKGDGASDGDGFGDFDDFGEVQEGEEFDDFGGFDEAATPARGAGDLGAKAQLPDVNATPVVDFTKLDSKEIQSKASEILYSLHPPELLAELASNSGRLPPCGRSMFLTERSLSLWNQLSAPPPLQPPNWKLSRIRRLFLVSLGVPVDLDEILPAETKQKKLILPSSPKGVGDRSSSPSSSSAGAGGKGGGSTSARNRHTKDVKLVDVPAARILCSTSDIRLRAYSTDELKQHVGKLEEITREASETLTYWLGRREAALGDKEAFESVIENLVVFARKGR